MTIDPAVVAALESRLVRALPPVESTTIDGWHVPFGRGEVGRMNSVTTFATAPWDLFETVETIERRYRARRRRPMFRLTALDAELDDLLFARGYERSGDVLVMTGPVAGEPDPEVTLTSAITPSWLADLGRMMGSADDRIAELGESLAGLQLRHGAFRIRDVAVGLAVVDGGWIGLFDVAVDQAVRRAGLGRRLCSAMLAWGGEQGATTAYLQVFDGNTAAVAMYSGLGFTESYRYWYRSRD